MCLSRANGPVMQPLAGQAYQEGVPIVLNTALASSEASL